MSHNRVQKLLFSEYCDFEDMVLIESPFAQTTKDGRGIRQVHLGLTPSKLVLATDVLPPAEYVNVKYTPGVDPEIETFELIAIYPVECVNLSVYRRKKKQALKARFCNNKVLYFELGGFERRAMFWNLWCERVKFLCPSNSSTSRSETSVATSSTCSTLYLLDKKLVSINGTKQLWCRFGSSTIIGTESATQEKLDRKWSDKHLYLGKTFEDYQCKPISREPVLEDFLRTSKTPCKKVIIKAKYPSYMEQNDLSFGDSVQVNRFGSGVNEGCGNPLYLTVDDYTVERRLSQMFNINSSASSASIINYTQLAESAVLTWEFYKANDPNKYKFRHKRRYGLNTNSLFLNGFTPVLSNSGASYSLQMKRVVSEIQISRKPKEVELVLPVARRLLKSSISHQCIYSITRIKTNTMVNAPKHPITLFWTTGYKYRPKSAKESYAENRSHITNIINYHENKKRTCRKRHKRFFKRQPKTKDTDEDSDEPYSKRSRKKKHGFIYNMFNNRITVISEYHNKQKTNKEFSIQNIKKALKIEDNLSAWHFDSTVLAEQLTLLEKDLFLKIPTTELEVLLWKRSSENAPNFCALVAFSHRISCLLATEILKNDTEKTRARLLARFINAANKCHRISNFQSCRTIMNGLQSPAIYRLKRTWAYLRKKHASKYQSFEILCRLYKDPRLPCYQRTFTVLSQSPPFLAFIGDITDRLLGKIPDYNHFNINSSPLPYLQTPVTSLESVVATDNNKVLPSLITKIYRALGGGDGANRVEVAVKSQRVKKETVIPRKTVKLKGLYEYYTDFDYSQDSRFKHFEEAKKFLEKCQLGAMDYNFSSNELAKAYLLKARYGEDKKNFYNSFSVESPRNYYEPKNK